MTLTSGGHVTIDGTDYLIAEDVDGHYTFAPQLVVPRAVDTGEQGALNPAQPYLNWAITDWVGGEGNRWYDPGDPDIYDYGSLNPRIRGQLTVRPARSTTTVTVTDGKKKAYLDLALGCVWLAGSVQVAFSTDYGASWTLKNASGLTIPVTATAGASDALYVVYGNGTNRGVLKHTVADAGTASASVIDSHVAAAGWIGACMFQGRLYLWTGRKFWEANVDATLPLTLNNGYNLAGNNGIDLDYSKFGSTATGGWWGDCVAGDDRVFAMLGMAGRTTVYHYYRGAFTDIWNLTPGFTGKSMCYQNGWLFVSGHWSGEGTADGYAGLQALVVKREDPLFLNYFRKQQNTNLQMEEMGPSYGNQVLAAAAVSGKLFVYDAEFNAVSMLDDLVLTGGNKVSDMVTMGPKRVIAIYQVGGGATTSFTTYCYSMDEPASRESTGTVTGFFESPQHNFGQPHLTKGLVGFYAVWTVEDAATTSGLLANQRITISYAIDGGTYTDLTSITSATTPSSGVKGRHFIGIPTGSTTVKFFNLKVKVTLDNNATTGVKPPILESVIAVALPVDFVNTWELALDVRDEDSDQPERNRVINRRARASVLRDLLRAIATNRKAVTFVDGYRYAGRDGFGTQSSSHVVFLEVMQDSIDRNAEGVMRVRLRELPT